MSDVPVHRQKQLRYLAGMGVEVWERRVPVAAVSSARTTTEEPARFASMVPEERSAGAPGDDISGLGWDALKARVETCRLCGLEQTRTRAVFGVGDPNADLVVIGEAPGAEEDRRGEPFVGRAGKLLDNMLRALGYSRETVFITNILKSRPPGNRDPKADEVEACMPYLRRQIALIQPRVILALGRVAAQNLLATGRPLRDLRAAPHEFSESRIPMVVTYHPAYLLRSPADKAKAWKDLRTVRSMLEQPA
ncbi:MAG: uracil-DNA glycosylase [Aquisalimonadaceae bacterium]